MSIEITNAILRLQAANGYTKTLSRVPGNVTDEASYLAGVVWCDGLLPGGETANEVTGNPPCSWAEVQEEISAWDAGAATRNTLAQIAALEEVITPRRIREAILGTDGGWLANQEALIAAERSKL